MGFKLGRTITLEFDDGYLKGAEVVMRAASVGTMLALRDMTTSEAVPLFVQHVVSWNFEDDNGDLPITAESVFAAFEAAVLTAVIGRWYEVATGVAVPLDLKQDDGQPSPATEVEELSIPMEVL